ncbi:MAG: ABC transporter substrate-binding protein [Dermatophilaceae bacterium]
MRTRLTSAFVVLTLALVGCTSIPQDPDGTLDRVQREGVLRVGASPSDRTQLEEDLARGFAAELGARVEWTRDGETALVGAMERGELDLLIGGLHADSPWSDKVSITRAYAESTEVGETVKHVLAVPLGENAMLVRLESYLDESTP